MRNILLFVSYDGTDFCGWQRQDPPQSARTVQGALEDALCRLHKCPTPVCGSGRTDSGVHAMGQAATFMSPIDSIPVERYPRAINSFLPQDVRVTAAREVGADFSARFSATSRVYRYFINTAEVTDAIMPRYSWCIHRTLDIDLLNALAGELHGETDCASFAAAECGADGAKADGITSEPDGTAGEGGETIQHSTCRYIERMRFFEQDAFPAGRLTVFEIEANAFLYHMVRNLAGTLLWLEQKRAVPGSFAAIAAERDRAKAGPTAPANGLFLWKVKFDGVRRHV